MKFENFSNLQVVTLKSVADVKRHWSFFLEGFKDVSFRLDDTRRMTPDTFLKFVLQVVDSGAPFGTVFLVRAKGAGKPLAFGIVANNSSPYRCTSALFHWYSTNEDVKASATVRSHAETWAQEQGYEDILVIAPKVTGAAFEKFEKRWGYDRRFVVFGKKLKL